MQANFLQDSEPLSYSATKGDKPKPLDTLSSFQRAYFMHVGKNFLGVRLGPDLRISGMFRMLQYL